VKLEHESNIMKTNIKNIPEASQRIKKACDDQQPIVLYGDSDMDGIASLVMLQEAIKNLNGNIVATAFPDRENDGYGINKKALEFLTDKAPALFITLDLGISNFEEIDQANELGFEVIVVDHHEILGRLPNASIIIDPKQPGDRYPFKVLCNAGVTFKLCEELLGKNFSAQQRNSFLELTALATISDMVPQIEDNKQFIEEGLRSLKNTFRPGLRVFLDILGQGAVMSGEYLKMISAFNSAESINFTNDSYVLLTAASPDRCREIAETLLGKTAHKQQKIKAISGEVERRISKKRNDAVIFEGDPAWRLMLAGPVASIIAQKYQKPTFIYKKGDTESCGSVRSLQENQNSVEAMSACKDILMTYGGHPKASGFRLKNENIEKFKVCLEKYFNSK
jgi:single-stranded-DNA-specific exonuclease